jgi:hypothetical protein
LLACESALGLTDTRERPSTNGKLEQTASKGISEPLDQRLNFAEQGVKCWVEITFLGGFFERGEEHLPEKSPSQMLKSLIGIPWVDAHFIPCGQRQFVALFGMSIAKRSVFHKCNAAISLITEFWTSKLLSHTALCPLLTTPTPRPFLCAW